MSAAATTFVHLHLDEFLVAAERHHDASLAQCPLVIGGSARAPGRVVAASAEARARGVSPGMALRDASRRCRRAVFLPGDLERLHDLRALVDEAVRACWPRVAWLAIDDAVAHLDGAGLAAAQRAAESLQQRLHDDLRLKASFGLASGPVAAAAAARLARPRGLVVVLPGYDARFLARLPLEEFEPLDTRSHRRLRAAGITTIGEVAALSIDRGVEILGPAGGAVVRMAAGHGGLAPTTTDLPRRLCRQRVFPHACALPDGAVEALAADLAVVLRRMGVAAGTLGLRVEDPRGVSVTDVVPLAHPRCEGAALQAVAARLAARVLAATPRIRLVSLAASGLVRLPPQGELFDRTGANGVGGTVAAPEPPRRSRWTSSRLAG